jgi:ubiquinone/menaquinone biosynthesis C-methylase UbiE
MKAASDQQQPSLAAALVQRSRLALRRLTLRRRHALARDRIRAIFDAAAPYYDREWTRRMRDCTRRMLSRLKVQPGDRCLDLCCGTGYAAHWLSQHSQQPVIGVDASAEMLRVAGDKPGPCEWRRADAEAYLREQEPHSFDVITCAWGLCYLEPRRVLRELARLLRPGGRLGLIDDREGTVSEVRSVVEQVFRAQPALLGCSPRPAHFRSARALAGRLVRLGLRCTWQRDALRVFPVASPELALERLRQTGASINAGLLPSAEGCEQACQQFIVQARKLWPADVPLIHRYLTVVAQK